MAKVDAPDAPRSVGGDRDLSRKAGKNRILLGFLGLLFFLLRIQGPLDVVDHVVRRDGSEVRAQRRLFPRRCVVEKKRRVDFEDRRLFGDPERFRSVDSPLGRGVERNVKTPVDRIAAVAGGTFVGPVVPIAVEFPDGKIGRPFFGEFIDPRADLVDRADDEIGAVGSLDVVVENHLRKGGNVTGLRIFRPADAFQRVAAEKSAGDPGRFRLIDAEPHPVVVDQRRPMLGGVIVDPRPAFFVVLVDQNGHRLFLKRFVPQVTDQFVPRAVRIDRGNLLPHRRVLTGVASRVLDRGVQNKTVGHQRVDALKDALGRNVFVRPEHRNRLHRHLVLADLFESGHFRAKTPAVPRLNRVPPQVPPFFVRLFAVRPDVRNRAAVIRKLNLPSPVDAVDHIFAAVGLVGKPGHRPADRKVDPQRDAVVLQIAHRLIAVVVSLRLGGAKKRGEKKERGRAPAEGGARKDVGKRR